MRLWMRYRGRENETFNGGKRPPTPNPSLSPTTKGATLPYSRKLEHTSDAGLAKHPGSGSEHHREKQLAAKSRKNKCQQKCQQNSGQGRGADRQPALLAAALWYAGRRDPVFPLHSVDDQGRCSCGGKPGCKPGKHPRIANGHHGATTDEGRIRRWWSRWPDANIGIPTGERSGLLVLDVDEHGFTSLDALEEEHGQLPETLIVRTGGGGMHAYFKYPAGSGIRNSAGRVGAGLDVRGEGGYIVAPPSRTDKGPYAFLDRLPRAEPPEWLLEAARAPHRAARDEDGAGAESAGGLDGEPIPFGERGDTLFRIACSLRARGCKYDRILSEIRKVNRDRCSPPIGAHPEDTDAGELEKIAESVVSRYPAGDASPEPPPEVLRNVEALFSVVLERLEWTGRGGPTDRAIYAALLITARRYGRPIRGGVKVYLSVRALADAAGVSRPTAIKALDRLRDKKLVYRASEGSGTKAGALILRVTQALTTQPRGGEGIDSGQPLSNILRELLRLRWGPGRLGKLRALLLELIARSGDLTLSELSEQTGRRPYNVRRALQLLEARRLVECFGENYRLVSEFAAVLDNELEVTGIKRAERLQRKRHAEQSKAYLHHLEECRRRKASETPPKPDGDISELERVELDKPPADAEVLTSRVVSSVSEVLAMARESFGLSASDPSESEPSPDKGSPAAFLCSELRGVTGMRYREMLRRWKDLGGKPETLEGAISAGPYRFTKEPSDFYQPYVYRSPVREPPREGLRAETVTPCNASDPMSLRVLGAAGQSRSIPQYVQKSPLDGVLS